MQILLNWLTNCANSTSEMPLLSALLVVLMVISLLVLLLFKKFFSHKITSNAISTTFLKMLEQSLTTISKCLHSQQSTEQQSDKSLKDSESSPEQEQLPEQTPALQLIHQLQEVLTNNEEH